MKITNISTLILLTCYFIFLTTSCTDTSTGNGGEDWITKPCDDSSASYSIADSERMTGTFYVSPTGCNLNEGTLESPWRTISFACNHVDEGSTIRLLAGTIIEDSICKVPKNVSIIGKGRSVTIVKSRVHYQGVIGAWDVAKDKYLFQFADNSDGIEISNFTLDGMEHEAHGGILINKVKNITIKNLIVRNFNFNGMWISNSENMLVDNISMIETSMPASNACSGMFMLGNATNVEIKNSKFTNSTKEHSGYGIKSWNYQWITSHPSDVDNTKVEFKNLNIHNNEFNLYPYGGWRNGTSANICVELYNSRLEECLIENNTFIGNLSMVGDNSLAGSFSVKVKNNLFLMPTINEGYQYAIENDFSNIEIAHNYFLHGRYPIASWHGKIIKNINVHHNVFDRILLPDGVLLFSGAPQNLTFENNSVLYDQQVFNFNGPQKGNCVFSILVPENINLISAKNNIFYCYDGEKKNDVPLIKIPDGTQIKATNILIDNNAFYNWTPDGTNALEIPTDSVVFSFTGQTYIQKYGLKPESICTGKNLGAIN